MAAVRWWCAASAWASCCVSTGSAGRRCGRLPMTSKVLIMAGGTGGHVFPALACARQLQAQGYEVHWLGTRRGIEAELIPAAGIPVHYIDIQGLRGKGKAGLLKAPVRLLRALSQSLKVVRQLQPVCVLGAGGYVTGPGGVAAWLRRIPLVIHEQNAVVGTTNRLLANIAARRCEGFDGSFAPSAKRRSTGNPVREDIFAVPPMSWDGSRSPRLLVLGGSLGALPLNRLLPDALAQLPADQRPQVRHQCGKQHVEAAREAYTSAGVEAAVEPFIADMAEAYAWADLVVCRAGALTVAELAAAGVGAILVPFPHAVDDHQTRNGQHMVKAGAAILVPQPRFTPEALADTLKGLSGDREKILGMAQAARSLARPDATERVVNYCLEAANG